MNKITAVIIEGKQYLVSHLSSVSLGEFIENINKTTDIKIPLHKYKVTEVK